MSLLSKSSAKRRSSAEFVGLSNRSTSRSRIALASIAAVGAIVGSPAGTLAADGTWNTNTNGSWSVDTNWLGNTVADGADSTANFVFDINGTRTVSLDSSRTIGNLTFQDAPTVSNDWVLQSSPAGNVLTLDRTTGVPQINVVNRMATITAQLAGNDGLEKTGAGNLMLSAANTYTGGTTITAGTLTVNNSSALGSSDITLGNATLASNNAFGNTFTLSNAINVTSSLSKLSTGDNGTFQLNGPISIASGAKLTADGRNGPVVVNGQISGAGNFTVNAGNVALNTANTVATVTQTAGSLLIGNNDALSSGVFTLAQRDATATLASTNATARTIANTLVLNGKSSYSTIFGQTTGGTGDLTFTGNGSLGTMRAVVNNRTEFSGGISGTGPLNLAGGAGTLVLSNVNSFTGSFGVSSGTVEVSTLADGGVNSSIGRSSNVATNLTVGDTFRFVGSTNGTTNRLFSINSSAPTLDASGTAPLQFTNSGSLAITNPPLREVPTNGIAVAAGTTTFTVPDARLLSVGMAVTASTQTTLPAGTTITAINGNLVTFSNGIVTGVPTFRTINFNFSGGPRTLTLTGSNTGANSLAPIIIDPTASNGSLNNTTAVLKNGSGTWAISGDNTYSGGTTVTAGTLLVNNSTGSGTGSGNVVVTGGTLGGNGNISGPVTITGGTLSPGNSAGQLTVGSLDLGTSSTTLMEIGGMILGTEYDNLTSDGSVIYGGSLDIVSIEGYDLMQTGVYDLFTFATLPTGGFSEVNFAGMELIGALGVWTGTSGTSLVTFTEATGDLVVSAVAVPEPATMSLLGLAGLLGLRRRR